ncbi:MAG: lipocalin family protein [Ekhidna sp.]
MKKTHIRVQALTFTITFLLGIAAFTNTADAQTTSSDLEGTWNTDYQKMINGSNFASGFDFSAQPAQTKAHMKETFESRTFTFNADQTVTVAFSVRGNSKQVDGTWSYVASNRLLTILINGASVEYRTTLQGSALSMEPLVLEANAVFKSLSLTKN